MISGNRIWQNRHVRWTCGGGLVVLLAGAGYGLATRTNMNWRHAVGDPIDELNGVAIYFNGGVHTTWGRNLSPEGYNQGIRYQCVEFVKRYYFERYRHRMPDAYGHAKDFFDSGLDDGAWNAKRGMVQYVNGGAMKPAEDDLVVFRPWVFNPYGHLAVVSRVCGNIVEVAQQNPGPFGRSRVEFPLAFQSGRWSIGHPRVLGWLRLPPQSGPDNGGLESSIRTQSQRGAFGNIDSGRLGE